MDTQQLPQAVQILFFLGTIIAIAGLSWYISSSSIKRQWKRYAQAETEAQKIRDLIVATHNNFKGKCMPPALRELLTEAWADYCSLAQRSYDVSNNNELNVVTVEVNEILERIKKQTLIAPTAADYEAYKLAIEEEGIEVHQKHRDAIKDLEEKLINNKNRIVQKRRQLDQEWAASLSHPTEPKL